MTVQMLARVVIEPSIYTVPAENITDEQKRFLRFHTGSKNDVWRWRVILGGMYLRAETAGHHCTIDIFALGNLVARGFMRALGDYSVDITPEGEAAC